jgi:hypothetical protein
VFDFQIHVRAGLNRVKREETRFGSPTDIYLPNKHYIHVKLSNIDTVIVFVWLWDIGGGA